MGLFSRKKNRTPVASPVSSTSSRVPTPPQPVEEPIAVEPPIKLSVVLDGWTDGRQVHCFTVEVDKDADNTGLRNALALHLGDVSMGLFKVSTPTHTLVTSKV